MENEETKKETAKKINLTNKIRKNPWIVSTIVLGILILVLLIGNFNITGNISKENVGKKLLNFYESNGVEGLILQSVEEDSGVYMVTFDYQGNPVTIFTTKDLKYAGSMSPLEDDSSETEEETQEEVPQTDKPVVGLYIWSYCPYGVTALEPFAQVASLLEDSADFKVYLYYAGHGDFEVQQNKIQACIQELNPESYWEYAETFAAEIYDKCYGDIDCDLEESTALMDSLGIDSDTVLSCVESQGEELLEEHYNAAKDAGVSGSPSLIINGIKVSVARTAEAYKTTVCSAFIESPEECNEKLDSTETTASGSC